MIDRFRPALSFLAPFLIFNIFIFFITYFHIREIEKIILPDKYHYFPIIVCVLNLLIAVVTAWRIRTSFFKKMLILANCFGFNFIIIFLLLLVAQIAPGSRAHFNVEGICKNALDEYYNTKQGENYPDKAYDMGNNGQRWFLQHIECENNFWNGKGAVFSENPPGFLIKI